MVWRSVSCSLFYRIIPAPANACHRPIEKCKPRYTRFAFFHIFVDKMHQHMFCDTSVPSTNTHTHRVFKYEKGAPSKCHSALWHRDNDYLFVRKLLINEVNNGGLYFALFDPLLSVLSTAVFFFRSSFAGDSFLFVRNFSVSAKPSLLHSQQISCGTINKSACFFRFVLYAPFVWFSAIFNIIMSFSSSAFPSLADFLLLMR